ncbi:MAG: hypothetical protein QNI94_02345 [Kiloniellales bacterium]|nr:hypothetical protein [Kiloniellales bacterium]
MGNEPAGSSFSQGQSGQGVRPTSYRVWVKVVGCDRDIMYTATADGRLVSYTDDGECLSGSRGRGGGDATGEAAPRGGGGQSF